MNRKHAKKVKPKYRLKTKITVLNAADFALLAVHAVKLRSIAKKHANSAAEEYAKDKAIIGDLYAEMAKHDNAVATTLEKLLNEYTSSNPE